ncbi:MAG: hypothetical protein AB7V46_15690 [Thermomicrobiales bacterium]
MHSDLVRAPIGKPEWLPAYRILTFVTAISVLVQAILASQWLFKGEANLLDLHEVIANVFFLVVVLQTVMTILMRFPGAWGRQLLLANGMLVLLTLAQTGLGYSGRESADAKAWHVPLGVLLFGMAIAISSLALRPAERD